MVRIKGVSRSNTGLKMLVLTNLDMVSENKRLLFLRYFSLSHRKWLLSYKFMQIGDCPTHVAKRGGEIVNLLVQGTLLLYKILSYHT